MAKKPQKTPMGQIRIIGGKWRGRKLPVLDSQGLRPTTDRVKETLFNWLMPVIQDARCLDCFAGSGGLGIEALSRYAKETTFIEFDRKVAQQITANLALLGADNGHVIQDSALNYLAKQGTAYDVVFLDPPFHQGMLANTLQLLENNQWLAEGCYIYIEEEVNAQVYSLPENWRLHREKSQAKSPIVSIFAIYLLNLLWSCYVNLFRSIFNDRCVGISLFKSYFPIP